MSGVIRAVTAALALALTLSACDGGSDDPDDPKTPTQEASSMYCDLIDPNTVEPIVGSNEIKDIGGPVPQDDYRRIQCLLSVPGEQQPLLSLYEFELWSEDKARDERAQMSSEMAKYAKEDPEHYVALESDGDDLGYAWYTGDTAAASLLTGTRHISVTAPATADQAVEFTPLLLKVAQEIDSNLDAWDAKNPS